MTTLTKKDINVFLGVMVVSLVGNVCADYALMWYGLSLIAPGESGGSSSSLTYFYVGQAIGVIAISPLLAVVFDRFSRFFSSMALDGLYALFLIAMGVLFKYQLLSPPIIFLFSMLTAALAILHKSSVGFAAVQRMSEITGVTDVVARFIAALNIPFLVGSVLSGVVFHYLGFIGCMAIGVATFLPMPFVYYRIFGSEKKKADAGRSSNFIGDLKEGVAILRADRLLSGTAVSIAVVNIASAVLPAIVGFAFLKAYPGRTDYASIAIALSILGGILVTKKVGEAAKLWPTQAVVPLSVLPAGIALVLCLVFPNPFLVALMFLLSCVGSAARNVSSGSLRVARVPKALIGRVNTVYSALLYVGQTIGGFVVIKAVQNDFDMAIWSILACFVAGSIVSYSFLPRDRVAAVLEVSK